jgi:hypothetical protein
MEQPTTNIQRRTSNKQPDGHSLDVECSALDVRCFMSKSRREPHVFIPAAKRFLVPVASLHGWLSCRLFHRQAKVAGFV